MRRLAGAFLAVPLLVASIAHAQGTLVVSQQKCAIGKVDQLHQMIDSMWLPAAQELVNEGKLLAAGSAYHSWGDEWNVVLWYTAADIPTFLAAFDDMFGRVNQRYPTLITQFQASCTEHKDSFYIAGKSTTPPPAAPRR